MSDTLLYWKMKTLHFCYQYLNLIILLSIIKILFWCYAWFVYNQISHANTTNMQIFQQYMQTRDITALEKILATPNHYNRSTYHALANILISIENKKINTHLIQMYPVLDIINIINNDNYKQNHNQDIMEEMQYMQTGKYNKLTLNISLAKIGNQDKLPSNALFSSSDIIEKTANYNIYKSNKELVLI